MRTPRVQNRKDNNTNELPVTKRAINKSQGSLEISNYVIEDTNSTGGTGKFRTNRKVREQRDLFTSTDIKYVRFVC